MAERIFTEHDLDGSANATHDCVPCGLAATFARHLKQHRRSAAVPVVQGHAAQPHSGSILVPHFATLLRGGAATDTTLWEQMTPELFSSWRPEGVTADDVGWLIEHRHDIINTRTLIRTGQPPQSPELSKALMAGRYLSAKLCLEMRDVLAAEWATR